MQTELRELNMQCSEGTNCKFSSPGNNRCAKRSFGKAWNKYRHIEGDPTRNIAGCSYYDANRDPAVQHPAGHHIRTLLAKRNKLPVASARLSRDPNYIPEHWAPYNKADSSAVPWRCPTQGVETFDATADDDSEDDDITLAELRDTTIARDAS